jgi:hypothetical protein
MARRIGYRTAWPVIEFWQDHIKDRMAVIRAFIDPIVERALMKKEASANLNLDGAECEDVTLLEHLARLTDGTNYF